MTVLTRKQREIREREAKILNTARKMLLELGYLGLNMDRVAEDAGCSKGTVYQHFTSKEDLLAALSTQIKRKRVEFIEKASNFKGRPRERMTALLLGEELLVSQYPEYSRTEELLYIQSIASKASSKHQEVMHEVEEHCLNLVGGIMNDGVECGDLVLPPNRNCYEMAFGLWALVLGSRSAPNACETLASMVRSDTIGVIRINQQALLDGWSWLPLSNEWDYDDTRRRAAAEAFSLAPQLSQAT